MHRLRWRFPLLLLLYCIGFTTYAIFNTNHINLEPNEVFAEVPRCNCRVRRTFNADNKHFVRYNMTSCGESAFARGSGQKVVGFSYYGDASSDHHKSKKYFKGLVDNLEAMPR